MPIMMRYQCRDVDTKISKWPFPSILSIVPWTYNAMVSYQKEGVG